jgi:hypothetical protein
MSEGSQSRLESLSATEYIGNLFEPSDTVAVLVLNRERSETVQRITRAERVASPEFQAWLRYKNVSGSDVYIGMNPLKEGASSRTKDEIKIIRHLYLDLDRDGAGALAAIRNSALVPPPNFVLDTSPGKHQVIWKVEGVSQEQAEALQKAMAREFGGDQAATDCTRVLRLPGFANKKHDQDYYVQVHAETDRTYQLRDFTIPLDSPEAPRQRDQNHERPRAVSATLDSQSEHDWAFAKRALARGDDPEELIRRIADYRADDKYDPIYYARLTVSKAQSELHKDRASENSATEDTSLTPHSNMLDRSH